MVPETEYVPEPDDPAVAAPTDLGESEDERESYPTQPVQMTNSVAPAVELSEGNDVIVFLSAHTDPGLGAVIHIVGSGQGAFLIASDEGRATVPGYSNPVLPVAELEGIARAVNQAQGHPIDVADIPAARQDRP